MAGLHPFPPHVIWQVFTPFRHEVEKKAAIRAPLAALKVSRGHMLVREPRCIVGGGVEAGGNSLLSTPKLFQYRPTLPHRSTAPLHNLTIKKSIYKAQF